MKINELQKIASNVLKEKLKRDYYYEGDFEIANFYPVNENKIVGSIIIDGIEINFAFYPENFDVVLKESDLKFKDFVFYNADGYVYKVSAFNKHHASYVLANKFIEERGFFRFAGLSYNRAKIAILAKKLYPHIKEDVKQEEKKTDYLEFEASVLEGDDNYTVDLSNDLDFYEEIEEVHNFDLFTDYVKGELEKKGAKVENIYIENKKVIKDRTYKGTLVIMASINDDVYQAKVPFIVEFGKGGIIKSASVDVASLYSLAHIKVYSVNVGDKSLTVAGFDPTAVYYALKEYLGKEDLKFEDIYKYGFKVEESIDVINDAEKINPWIIYKEGDELFIQRRE